MGGLEKWWRDLAWYSRLGLVFGGMIVAVAGMIIYSEMTAPDILFDARLPAVAGEKAEWEFEITEPGDDYVLVAYPDVADGWGSPVVQLSLVLVDPDGRVLLDNVGRDGFGGEIADMSAPSGTRTVSYERTFPFKAAAAGKYSVSLAVFTEHVDNVHLSVGRKKSGK